MKDYEHLNPYDAIEYDKRTFLELLFDYLKKDNVLINLFFYTSLMEPLWIRILLFYFNLNLTFASSAFFFSDDFIDLRASLPEKERVRS